MNKRSQAVKYLLFDFIAAATAWTAFYSYRKLYIEPQKFGIEIPLEFTNRFYLGLFFIPLFWITIYYISGQYTNVLRKSRLIELGKTLLTSITGVVIIFFLLLLDDSIGNYKNYYNLFFTLLLMHFGLTYLFRLVITTRQVHRIHSRKIGFNTLIIGGNEKALRIYQNLNSQYRPAGHKVIGFLSVGDAEDQVLSEQLQCFGTYKQLTSLIEEKDIEEIIIAIESSEHKMLSEILTLLQNRTITVWGIPDLFDLLSGHVKTNIIYSIPLLKISNGLMPAWQEKIKRIIDVLFSMIALLIFLPVMLILTTLIKRTKGPIFYSQERIGRFGKPFTIYKFRSMVQDAELEGPALSSKNDSRITPIGNFMRRTHLDEIPQFWNVIRGDMSLVGPRPERKYYIDQIVQQAPHYTQLHKIRPGITSWGQVKYGYASNVDEMLERLPYDLVYLKNISLYVDFKILIYTLMICFRGQGK